jgi:hypothetical protein
MRTVEIKHTPVDLSQYKKREALQKDTSELITQDTFVTEDGEPKILYATMPKELTKNLRWAVKTIKYNENKRTNGLKSNSKIFGYMPRRAIQKDTWATADMANQFPKQHHVIANFATHLEKYYREYFPTILDKHYQEVQQKVRDEWTIPGTPFTSGIVNKDNQLNYHHDAGNFRGVLSNMICFKKGVKGGHLSIPEYDIRFEIGDNSLVIFDGQRILHGVTPFEKRSEKSYRITAVYYSLEQMWKCEDVDTEVYRVQEKKTEREKKRLNLKDE